MQTVKHILSAILILSILATGLPVFSPEDANRDTRVDLKDAVLHVQNFAQTANNLEAFVINLENAVFVLQALAGLKTIIKPADNAKSATAPQGLVPLYLISSFDFSFSPAVCSKTAVQLFCYQSILFSPDSPPPQASSIC